MTTSSPHPDTFQIPLAAAELYEAAFVPAFFSQWAPLLCGAAHVRAGRDVLDVACGTGIVAREAAGLVGGDGTVTGVDLNEAMLTVARRVAPSIDWRQGDAEALPLGDSLFDTVLCQMALMFFPDRPRAVAEMRRVARSGGTVAVLVPGLLEDQPAFAPFVELAAGVAGDEAAHLLGTYFGCGVRDELEALVAGAGLEITASSVPVGTYRAPSVDAFVTTEVESTPLVERISEDAYRRLREGAVGALAPFTADDGGVHAPFPVNMVVARRP